LPESAAGRYTTRALKPKCDGDYRADTFCRNVIIDTLTPFVNAKVMAREKTEHLIATARKVFLRYGYRRVTMGDLAESAQMSRPALYLVFPSNEQIFTEVVSRLINVLSRWPAY
jgi:Bacterial regulatory proteins, tetR family